MTTSKKKKGTAVPAFDPSAASQAAASSVGGFQAVPYGSTSATPKYLGGGTSVGAHNEYDTTPSGGRVAVQTPGYVKGDEVKLLPSGQDLVTLQQALIQAGYITAGQAKQMVLGSPDQITSSAFAKLLATANYSAADWRDALASRLVSAAQTPPDTTLKHPPLTISLTNPDDIKAVANSAAQTLYGTYLSPDQLDSFTKAYQAQEAAQQTAAYGQEYDPTGAQIYNPAGGTTTSPATTDGMKEEIEQKIRDTKPQDLARNTFTANLNTVLQGLTQNSTAPRLTA
jgi:hypothetical protein